MPEPAGAKTPATFRLRPETLAQLRQRAGELGQPLTALVERYVEEGLHTDRHPLVYFRDGPVGRRPALHGTRLDVWQVVETVRQNGNSVAKAAEYLELPEEKIEACIRYYADYKDEIDEWTARAQAAAEREEAAWRRRQEILA